MGGLGKSLPRALNASKPPGLAATEGRLKTPTFLPGKRELSPHSSFDQANATDTRGPLQNPVFKENSTSRGEKKKIKKKVSLFSPPPHPGQLQAKQRMDEIIKI